MNSTDQLVASYLKRLDKELGDLPRARRRELVEEISEHIDEARSGLDGQSEAEVRNLLDRLGDPADIAAEARERFGVQPKKSGAGEVAALILLPIGGLVVPLLGWVVGVVLLWVSDVWSRREKLIGTFVVPGGLALPVYLFLFSAQFAVSGGESCVSTSVAPRGHGQAVSNVSAHAATCTSSGSSTLVSILVALGLVALFVAPLVTTVYLARRMKRRSKLAAAWGAPGAAA